MRVHNKYILLCSVAAFTLGLTGQAYAGPEGGVVVGGSANISQSGTKTDIHQHSNKAILDWRSFDVGAQEHVEFHQPSSNAMALNRIKDTKPSQINGKLTANGHVMLINPNGVVFGASSQVDVGSLTATTADIDNDDFMAGRLDFNKAGKLDAAIINEGSITVKEAGLVNLVAPRVENHGIIEARLGKVQLAAADIFTLDMAGDGLLQVVVTEEQAAKLTRNTGHITAEGGTIALTASRARTIVDTLVENSGIIEAHSMTKVGGKIILGGGDTDVTINRGVLNASGRKHNVQGGQVNVLGQHIAIAAGSLIDASGQAIAPVPTTKPDTSNMAADDRVKTEDEFLADDWRGGGSIKIGGDYLGTGNTPTAQTLYVDVNTLTLNDGLTHGDGGRTIFWSDHTTDFNGLVLSRGGTQSGNGGFLETSGKLNLKANGFADLTNTADTFNKGTYLLDPDTITIYGNFDPTDIAGLQLWLDASDTSSITESGGLVSQWSDKSNNDNHASQGTILRQPTTGVQTLNGLNVINFSDDYLVHPSIDVTGGYSGFYVIQQTATTNPISYFHAGNIGGGAGDIGFFSAYPGGPANQRGWSSYSTAYGASFLTTNEATPLTWNLRTHLPSQLFKNGGEVSYGSQQTVNGNSISHVGTRADGVNFYHRGNIGEVIFFDTALSKNNVDLINQYQSEKWGVALDPLAGGGSELVEATAHNAGDPSDAASNGFNVFTTRYLERLAESADVHLRAASGVTLDLDGDTLNFTGAAAGKSLTIQTDNGDITDISAGTIRTTRTGLGAGNEGNITLIAGGVGNITLDTINLEALGGGHVNMDAGGNINLVQGSSLNLGNVTGASVSIESSGGAVGGTGGVVAASGTTELTANGDLDTRSLALITYDNNISLSGDNVLLGTALHTGTGSVSVSANQDISLTQSVMPSNLAARWALDDASGINPLESITSGNDASFGGDPSWSADTPFNLGSSLAFDGNDSVDSGFSAAYTPSDSFTYSAWVKTNTVPRADILDIRDFSKPNNPVILITHNFRDVGGVTGLARGASGAFKEANSGGVGFNDNDWHHVALTVNNGDGSLFVDGQLSDTFSGVDMNINLADTTLFFGSTEGTTRFFTGNLDDIRVYDTALGLGDIQKIASPLAFIESWQSGSIVLNAGRDVTLNDSITASNSGNAIVVNADRNFMNNAGAGVFNTSDVNGRWLVYSSDPVDNALGGLSADFKRYNRTYAGYAPASVTESGNGLLYSIAPTIIYAVSDDSVEYGDAYTATPTLNYVSGLIDGDALGSIGLSGAANSVSTYTMGDDAGTYANALTATVGTLTSELRYQFAFQSGDLTVTPATLEVFADDLSFTSGSPLPVTYRFTGFKNGENEGSAGISGDPVPASLGLLASLGAGTYNMTVDVSGLNATNYDFTSGLPEGILTILAAQQDNTALPNTVQKLIVTPQKQLAGNGHSVGIRNSSSFDRSSQSESAEQEDETAVTRRRPSNETQNVATPIDPDILQIEQSIIELYDLCSYNIKYCQK